jgi:Chalcone isomerase-like
MKKLIALAFSLSLVAGSTALAKEVAGVTVPDSITVEGKTLRLNGAGIRKKAIFKVYVGVLYVENPSKDAAAVTSSDQVKRMQLSVLRSLSSQQVNEAIEEGF